MEGNQMASVADLEAGLGYRFRDAGLLRLALTHPSLAHEMGGGQQHNQRLEFLGDAVLQLIITTRLFEQYPDLGEGPLTQARAQMVNRTMLAQHGRKLDLGSHLVLSRGEESSGGRMRSSTIADAFEALIGAVYLDSDFPRTTEIVLNLYKEVLGELEVLPNLSNPKGELQELLQSTSPEPPRYELKSSSGPDHNRSFECAVTHRGQELGRGFGRSKKTAESAAAQSALDRLRQGGAGANVENPS